MILGNTCHNQELNACVLQFQNLSLGYTIRKPNRKLFLYKITQEALSQLYFSSTWAI